MKMGGLMLKLKIQQNISGSVYIYPKGTFDFLLPSHPLRLLADEQESKRIKIPNDNITIFKNLKLFIIIINSICLFSVFDNYFMFIFYLMVLSNLRFQLLKFTYLFFENLAKIFQAFLLLMR
jgi:hypothetical protein